MMMRLISCQSDGWRVVVAVVVVGSTLTIGSQSAFGQNKARGAVLGGLGGAVVGGLIGDHNDKAGAGAAIGGAIGAVSGAVLGNARDQEIAQQRQRQYYAHQERVYVQQQQQQALIQAAVSTSDIVSMSRSGLSDSVIINQIHSRGVQRQLQVNDIISLHQQGVSENVITAMQNAQVGSAPQSPVVIQQQPVVVQQPPVVIHEQYVVPRYAPPPTYYYHRGYHRGF
jgi:outer membrane lipoprotein SlyB